MRALTAALLVLGAAPARAEPVLWSLRDHDSTVTLLPSVHALPPGVDWKGPKVEAALAAAEVIVFEFPQAPSPSERGAVADRMAALGRAEEGRGLSAHLSPAARERLARHAPALGLDPARLEGLKPWYAQFLLEQAADRRGGARLGLGVEQALVAAAAGRRLEALEGADDVVTVLSGYPDAESVRALEVLLAELDSPKRRTREHALERAWAQGRLGPVIEAVEAQAAASPGVHDRLVAQRNRRWAEKVAAYLEGSEDVLVVVGAAHLVGPQGLPALLRARGLRVEGP
jgi:hypothetical protein